jgi:predicted membrane-bound spermidine synthase
MLTELPISLRSPVHLPEGKSGKMSLRHSDKKRFDVVSVREGLLTGRLPQKITLSKPVRIHELYEEGMGLWIADIPIEIRQHKEALVKMAPRGNVLVGGLGLGIAATLLANMPQVDRVDVVEINPDVIKLCDPHHPKVRVIDDDLKAFLGAQQKWLWDSAFFDTWTATSEGAWWEDVFPLRRIIGQRFGKWYANSVFYWAEDIMLGQVGRHLMTATQAHWYYKEGLDMPMTLRRAKWFVKNIGTPGWEKRYGKLYPEEEFNG